MRTRIFVNPGAIKVNRGHKKLVQAPIAVEQEGVVRNAFSVAGAGPWRIVSYPGDPSPGPRSAHVWIETDAPVVVQEKPEGGA